MPNTQNWDEQAQLVGTTQELPLLVYHHKYTVPELPWVVSKWDDISPNHDNLLQYEQEPVSVDRACEICGKPGVTMLGYGATAVLLGAVRCPACSRCESRAERAAHEAGRTMRTHAITNTRSR